MTSTEQVVLALLATLDHCRRELDETVRSLRVAGESSAETLCLSYFNVWPKREPSRIDVTSLFRVVPSGDEADGVNDVGFFVSIEADETGLRVETGAWAMLEVGMGACPPGDHDFYQSRSESLTIDRAVSEAKAQVAALRALDVNRTALGLTVTPPALSS